MTLAGVSLARSPLVTGGKGSVLPALMGTFSKKESEPKWFDSAECIDAARRLQVQNLTTIAAGLGATTSPAESLRNVRNFYAHRGKRTAQEAGKFGIFVSPNNPDVFELAGLVRPGLSHPDAWIWDLNNTLRAAAQ